MNTLVSNTIEKHNILLKQMWSEESLHMRVAGAGVRYRRVKELRIQPSRQPDESLRVRLIPYIT